MFSGGRKRDQLRSGIINPKPNFRVKILNPVPKNTIMYLGFSVVGKIFLETVLAQFVSVKPLSYFFEETIGCGVNTLFASRPLSPLIR